MDSEKIPPSHEAYEPHTDKGWDNMKHNYIAEYLVRDGYIIDIMQIKQEANLDYATDILLKHMYGSIAEDFQIGENLIIVAKIAYESVKTDQDPEALAEKYGLDLQENMHNAIIGASRILIYSGDVRTNYNGYYYI